MTTYEKIETIYQRDIEGTKKLVPNVWRNPTVEFCKDLDWEWTEKIDGTNIRIHWDGHVVEFGGRTDKAQIPATLVNRLQELFGGEQNAQLFEQAFGDKDVTLFGEGYGNKIQGCGKLYIPDGVDFIMFDLLINGNYQSREDVERCATMFGVKTVPIVGHGTLEQAVEFIKDNPTSTLGNVFMEGVVCRPKFELRDRCGNRLIVKIKWCDFKDI